MAAWAGRHASMASIRWPLQNSCCIKCWSRVRLFGARCCLLTPKITLKISWKHRAVTALICRAVSNLSPKDTRVILLQLGKYWSPDRKWFLALKADLSQVFMVPGSWFLKLWVWHNSSHLPLLYLPTRSPPIHRPSTYSSSPDFLNMS